MCKSDTATKAYALFGLFDADCSGFIGNEDVEELLSLVFNETRRYSELLSELNQFKLNP